MKLLRELLRKKKNLYPGKELDKKNLMRLSLFAGEGGEGAERGAAGEEGEEKGEEGGGDHHRLRCLSEKVRS